MSQAPLPLDEEAWDDTLILELFEAAVETHKSHRRGTKAEKKRRVGENQDGRQQSRGMGIPGQWHTVSSATSSGFDGQDGGQMVAGEVEIQGQSEVFASALYKKGLETTPVSVGNGSTAPQLASETVEGALQDMLTAWYNCGVATGRYKTLLDMRNKSEN